MAHDFAKKSKASKPRKRKKKVQPPAKNARSFFAGLAVGLVLGPLLYLAMIADSGNEQQVADSSESSASHSPKTETEKSGASLKKLKDQIEFEFYDLLPKQKMGVAVEPEPIRDSKKSDRRYMLQAGSFRKESDADQLRVQLIMKGLTNTKVNSVTRSGSTWHRVLIGPFDSKRVMNQARNVLYKYDIDSLVLTTKK